MNQPTTQEQRNDIIACLREDLVYLYEIRGELDEGTNARTEAKIDEIMRQIKQFSSI